MRLKVCLLIGIVASGGALALLTREADVPVAVIGWAQALGAQDLAGVRERSSQAFAAEVWSHPTAHKLLVRPESRRAGDVAPLSVRPVERDGDVARVRLEGENRHLVFHCVRENGRWVVDDVTIGAAGEGIALRESLRVVLAFLKKDSS